MVIPSVVGAIERSLMQLWEKYADELAALARVLAPHLQQMIRNGFGSAFCDTEGELLYILVRELRPEVVFEISPNSGFSTNYLLAAVTRNGTGRVESFELIDNFNGVPTAEVIRGHLTDLCDPSRHHLTIGDARIEALRRLEHVTPDFTLIDSGHDNIFAEFYVKTLLPRLNGLVVIQDILHFDPRPEPSSESYYVLSWLAQARIPYVPLALYEDLLNASSVRRRLAPRRPLRSNSIVIDTRSLSRSAAEAAEDGESLIKLVEAQRQGRSTAFDPRLPLTSTKAQPAPLRGFAGGCPEDRYVTAVYGRTLNEESPGLSDVRALKLGVPLTGPMAQVLTGSFDGFDPESQCMILDALTQAGRIEVARDLIRGIATSGIRGTHLPEQFSYIALRLEMRREALFWSEACLAGGADHGLSTGYRNLLNCAILAENLRAAALADRLYEEVRAIRAFQVAIFGESWCVKFDRELAVYFKNVPRHAP